MPVTLGFIGAGNISRVHMKSARQLGLNLAGTADINPAAAEAAAKEFGVRKAYDDYRPLLADKDIAGIVVATPNKFHAEHAIAALEAGKHVFLEKPMAMSVAESDAIIAAMKKSGRLVQMGMVNRFRGAVQAIKGALDAGRCGKLYSGQAHMYRRRGIPGFGGWFTTKSQSGGGALIDVGVHLLDLSLYLMDFPKPVAVSGMTYNVWKKLDEYRYLNMWGKPQGEGKKDVDDYALATIRFEGGATLQLNVSWSLNIEFTQPDSGLRLMGEQGGVALKGLEEPWLYAEEFGQISDTRLYYASNDYFLDEMQHFADCIENRREPMPTAQQGRTVMQLLGAIYQSSEQQREIRLDS
ncbi:MAG: oxidoreductase domain protein [Phycisphaerales bacterium]|nr:oxidoreductase domain protein [Phycisphaerales bacterium]